MLRTLVGDMERYGLPQPDHAFGSAHPTVSDDALSRIAHGEITPKPNLASLGERTVRFADGSEVDADVVVYCTGYKVTFPFLDPDLISAPGQRPAALPARLPSRRSAGSTSSGCSSRSARSCRSPSCSRSGSATTSPGATTSRRRTSCAPTSRPSAPRCSSATSRRSGTRCRSTSRTTCSPCAASAGAAPRGPSWRAGGCPSRRAAGRCRVSGGDAGRRERTKAANRAALVAAARDAFGELGYEAVGVRDIVRRTDLASGTFYNYFPDKEAVFRAVVEDDRRRGAAPRARGPRGRARARGVRRRRLPRLLRLHRRGPGDVRLPAPQRRHARHRGPRARAAARRRRARAETSARSWRAAPCPRSTSTTGPTPWSRSASSWARAWPSATRRTSRARRASPPSCSSAACGAPERRLPRMPDDRLAAAQRLFSPEGAYLNTATYGLPPRTRVRRARRRRRRVAPRAHRLRRLGPLGRRGPGALRAARGRGRGRRGDRQRRVDVRRPRRRRAPAAARACSPSRATSRACCSRSSPRRRAA